MTGGLDVLRVVERGQGLEGRVGALAAHGADLAAGRVKISRAGGGAARFQKV